MKAPPAQEKAPARHGRTAPRVNQSNWHNHATNSEQCKPKPNDEPVLFPNGRFFPDPPKMETSLGFSLFRDPLAGQSSIGDIRQRLELKYAACIVMGGTNGFPLHVNRIQNPKLRALAAVGMALKLWCIRDLIDCTGALEGPASSVLLATLESPIWGPDDFRLFDLIDKLEGMQTLALGGGRTL